MSHLKRVFQLYIKPWLTCFIFCFSYCCQSKGGGSARLGSPTGGHHGLDQWQLWRGGQRGRHHSCGVLRTLVRISQWTCIVFLWGSCLDARQSLCQCELPVLWCGLLSKWRANWEFAPNDLFNLTVDLGMCVLKHILIASYTSSQLGHVFSEIGASAVRWCHYVTWFNYTWNVDCRYYKCMFVYTELLLKFPK